MKKSTVAGLFLIISLSIPSSHPSLLLIALSMELHHRSHPFPSAGRNHSAVCV